MKQICVRFAPDTPESYKAKTIKKIIKLGWVQNNKKIRLIPANDDPNQKERDITFFFDWPHDSEVVYPEEVEFAILP
ncbi:hypothetical protein H8693_00635 [Christensenellaceae bacterium NSJ-63]|uniref:Uncharacterized protein n=1 Tax=Guopingia tenuis TaxID=2763656 RepID=A0A926HVL3_9FIRM|nr:hypothetical protein [Guopingia tenuis]MBC8537438.1 hypothetical protein [Guopingia tenuis]